MKKLLRIFLCMLVSLSLLACNSESKDNKGGTGTIPLPTVSSVASTKTASPEPVETELPDKIDDKDDMSETDYFVYSYPILVEAMDFTNSEFAIAYLGYYYGEHDSASLISWLDESIPNVFKRYPYLREACETNFTNGFGDLYLLVPKDENASVAINRISYENALPEPEVTDVVYRSEEGSPVLFFSNYDEFTYQSDTVVTITTSEKISEWYVSMSSQNGSRFRIIDVPFDETTGEQMLFDMSPYEDIYDSSYYDWISAGWGGLTEMGLEGTCWAIWSETESHVLYFFSENKISYEHWKDYKLIDCYDGEWFVECEIDEPSMLTLKISKDGGSPNYPNYIDETYPILTNPAGSILLMFNGQKNDTRLPFMPTKERADGFIMVSLENK